jgi:HD-like signal output (HDOD) protein
MAISRWTQPFSRWLRRDAAPSAHVDAPLSPRPASAPTARKAEPIPAAAPATAVAVADTAFDPETQPLFLAWLLGSAPPGSGPVVAPMAPLADVMARLDAATATEAQRSALLPRAPQVVPQLMKALRDEHYASADVAERLSKDAVLATEVIRLANRAQRADREPVVDLAHAVMAIGADGLRRVIAKSVLRPMFDVRGTSLSALAAPQIWKDGDRKARLCAALAANDLLDPLDGYLAGLLHNTGWTAVLRALDAIPEAGGLLQSRPVDAAASRALARRRDTLFGRLLQPWDLSPALGELADEVGAAGLAGVSSPLGLALQYADGLAALHALARARQLPGGLQPHLERLPPTVQDCYVSTLGGS